MDVVDWLLDSDPAIRWQVMRDLADTPEDDVAAERARVATEEARQAVRRVREHVAWEHDGEPFFAGEVEPCINGKVVALGAYFGEHVDGIVERLL